MTTVMLVSSNITLVASVANTLRSHGVVSQTYANTNEAWDAVKETLDRVQVLVTEYKPAKPGSVHGHALSTVARHRWPKLHVYYLAEADESSIPAVFLPPPHSADEIVTVVLDALNVIR